MDPKRRKKEEGKQAKKVDPLEVQSILFEIALGLSVEEIIAWCNLNKFFAKMCDTHFPGEKLYQLGLVDLEVLLNETVTGFPGRWEEPKPTPKLSEVEITERRKKEIERRKNEVIQMAKDFNDTIFLNEPKALALHKAMLSTWESLVFFFDSLGTHSDRLDVSGRLDVYFGYAKNEVWERFPNNSEVTERPLFLVKVDLHLMGEPLTFQLAQKYYDSEDQKIKYKHAWTFDIWLGSTKPDLSKLSGQRVAEEENKNKLINLLNDDLRSANLVMVLFPKDAKPIKRDAHLIRELFQIRKSVSFKDEDFREGVDGIGLNLVKLEFEGSFLSQKWEAELKLQPFLFLARQQFRVDAYKFSLSQHGETIVEDMRWQQAWFTLGPVWVGPFVSEMLVNAGLRKRLLFPDY